MPENTMRGPHFCSMKITQEVRDYAAQQGVDSGTALEEGTKEKAEEFLETGGKLYHRQ